MIKMSESRHKYIICALHAVSLIYEDVDDQLLVLRFPPSVFWMSVNDRVDIGLDVLLLFTLVVQGNRAENKRVEDILDISFWSTSDAYAQIRKLRFDKLL